MTWLLDTLVWTGALIALVLLLRRAVGRYFGARTAYALWLLPFLRLLLPPLVLPAPRVAEVVAGPTDLSADSAVAMQEVVLPAAGATSAATPNWLPTLETALVFIWLVGAVLYVILRLVAYQRLRAQLLAGARTVGEAGAVRLLETRATRSPLAFGVFDKVVALPVGFMAMSDRPARDLALAHELAHHQARDLAANFAALPLFALHWFNPLSWWGWRAMRRDQEAACDARVVSGRDRFDRARYAALIAGTAAYPAPRVALAAPMACPVLGDKSIIHRLRNLTMNELSVRRRRVGSAIVGLAALALPLTASITYAQDDEVEPPVAPAPPAPPAAPGAPAAPDAPAAPLAPPAPLAEIDPSEQGQRVMVMHRADGTEGDHADRTFVIRTRDGDLRWHADGDKVFVKKLSLRGPNGERLAPDSPEFKARMKEFERQMEQLDKRIEKSARLDEAQARQIELHARDVERVARSSEAMARSMPRIEESCDGMESTTETRTENGRQVIRFCRKIAMSGALEGLRSARAAIAGNDRMSADTRREVLRELDSEIERLEQEPKG